MQYILGIIIMQMSDVSFFVSELSEKRSYLYCTRIVSYRSLVLISSDTEFTLIRTTFTRYLCVVIVGLRSIVKFLHRGTTILVEMLLYLVYSNVCHAKLLPLSF